ncbi:hypothetical protein EV178_001878 [Coemansia sp. RSA 1646]|nr:hypothetical protein EV178_001878 [Coemansia sp. RSA 1646]
MATYGEKKGCNVVKAVDPVEHRRSIRQEHGTNARKSVASDISPTPTLVVRLSNLPNNTTPEDVRYSISSKALASKINFLKFEYDYNLRPLNSCRVTFFNAQDAYSFLTHTQKIQFAGHTIRSDFVLKSIVPNKTRDKYVGNALGRLVFLYGYPPYVNQHQVRDYYRQYDIVDTTIPGVQPAPLMGQTFLSRRGAFIVQFSTSSEAHRFIRDVYNTEYVRKGGEEWQSVTDSNSSTDSPVDSKQQHRYFIKAILLQ